MYFEKMLVDKWGDKKDVLYISQNSRMPLETTENEDEMKNQIFAYYSLICKTLWCYKKNWYSHILIKFAKCSINIRQKIIPVLVSFRKFGKSSE